LLKRCKFPVALLTAFKSHGPQCKQAETGGPQTPDDTPERI